MKHYIESFAKPVLTAAPDEPLAKVADTMAQHNVGAVVVVEGHNPVGIVTDRDLALALALDGATPKTPVARVMSSPIEIIPLRAGVFEATQVMRERNVRRLAVVDEDGELAGFVTRDDLLRLMSSELANLVEAIRPEMQVT